MMPFQLRGARHAAMRSLCCSAVLLVPASAPFLLAPAALAQTGGEGAVQGSVLDSSGAAIPNATVVVTNDATGVSATRRTTGDGVYAVSPILPGTYTVTVSAAGFGTVTQKNLTVNALTTTPLTVTLNVGGAESNVTVTEAPPMLETSNATLGLTIENETYANLPLQVNNGMRDPTAFGTLVPGSQGGTRLPVIGGTGNYLGQLYLDGLPAQTINQQGDNRLVSQAVTVDAVDQFQVITSTPPAEYSGAGSENFTMKSGGLKYHGSVNEFVRNTVFDAWSFTSKAATQRNALGQTVPAPKPIEHQNEFSATFGGHVPLTKKVFFFVAYDRFHSRRQVNPASFTVPTALEKAGDFTELNGNVGGGGRTGTGADNPAVIFDPTSTACVGAVCTRQPFRAIKNGVLTNNVIPANYLSPIAQKMQSYLPDPTNPSSLANNYTAGIPSGFDNHAIDWRVDYDASSKHRISSVGAMGAVNYLNNFSTPYLPLPYTGGDYANIFPKVYTVEDAYTVSNSVVNQLKFGYVRFYMNIANATQNTQYGINNLGVTNLPAGQAGVEFPGVSFAAATGQTAITTWTTNSNSASTQITTPNNYTLVDNLQWVKGSHSLTFGIQVQWQQINNANPATYTGILSLPFTNYSTANFNSTGTTSALNAGNGNAYASFLLGAVGGSPSLGLQPVSETGGRYRPIAPYVEDTWKVNNKLTIDAGLRWDYLPPFHEVKDRWSFLNPNQTNSITGTPGQIQFAGSYGGSGVSCGCRTPVQTYWNNWGPRVGITYAIDDRTVFRIGAGRVFSQGGGVGGRVGAANGTGALGFNVTANAPQSEITTGANAGPSFYLNNSAVLGSRANTDLFGKGYAYPTPPTPSAASQVLNTGFYVNNAGSFVNGAAVSYADPYLSGRAPNFNFYNAGMQHSFTNDLTLAINYVGNQSHHLVTGAGNPRGYYSNQLDPKYLPLGTLLSQPATPANVAAANAIMPGINVPAFFQNAATRNTSATIAQGLTTFPQYSGVNDTWGQNVGNNSYNSLQVTVQQRFSRGLTFNFNYTWAKNIGDDGTFRSGFDIPAYAISRNTSGQSWHQDRIDRSWTTIASPHTFHAFGVYKLPIGKGGFGANNWAARNLAGGWTLSGIWTYTSGVPVALTLSPCTNTSTGGITPLSGTCMPDVNPAFVGSARQNGGFGSGPNGRTTCNLGLNTGCTAISYINPGAFLAPQTVNGQANGIQLVGNAPRTRAYGLVNPAFTNFDASVRRTFPLFGDRWNFVFEVDAINVANHTNFASMNTAFGATNFGTITATSGSYNPRDFQFAGHINF